MMHLEENRYKSLDGLVFTRVTRREVAKAGFYAPNRNLMENIVSCYFCDQKVSSWDNVDDVSYFKQFSFTCLPIYHFFKIFQHHQTTSPECPFVRDPDNTTNVPEFTLTELKDEQNRIATFKNWPVSFLNPIDMAKAGFYYLQKQDQAKCAWCGGAIGQWEQGDEPMFEHRKFFPNCPKVLEGSNTVDATDYGIQSVKAPKKQQYATLESRTRTFDKWNHSHVQHPDRLAQAGFYFLGLADEVRCFYCDGGLRFWQREDDPWFEHARCFPKCQFVQLVKGQQYIDTVLSQSPDEANSTETTDEPGSSNTSIAARTSSGACPPMSLDDALSTEPVLTALAMGLNAGRIRNLTKMQLEKTGRPYLNSQELIEVVLDTQLEDEAEDLDDGGSTSSGLGRRVQREVTDLIWGAITKSKSMSENVTVENSSEVKSTNDDRLSLEEENKRLKEARECKICMSEEVGVVFCPCGHLGKYSSDF